jgi:hypothetical protein
MSIKINQPKLLIVEGSHEESFFNAAFAQLLRIVDIQVLAIGGKNLIRQNLRALVRSADFPSVASLAVIRDADITDPNAVRTAAETAFQSVSDSLIHAGLSPPTAHGAFFVARPKIGVFIMPNGNDDGMLETLCMRSVETEPEFHCLTDYFTCLSTHGIRPVQQHKAHAHAWLASRPEPDRHVGRAAEAGYWPWGSNAFDDLWAFLRSM